MKYLSAIKGNSQKLDGGAMFGNVPKALWSQWVNVDDSNRIHLACRGLLIEDSNKRILVETGIGAFFEPKLKQRYGVVEEDHVLLNSLQQLNLSHEQIDYVIISHLHFDHAGGLLSQWHPSKSAELLFPNAKFITSKIAWERACDPHPRDHASFIPELNALLKDSGRLILIDPQQTSLAELGTDYYFHHNDGHTPGMLLTEIRMPASPIIFMADLIPGTPWIHLPVTMGYDRFPEQLINEKAALLEYALKTNARLFYTHDEHICCSTITQHEHGKYQAHSPLNELIKYSD